MLPNPQVYGDAGSWHDNFTFGGSTAAIAAELKASRPKVPMFDNQYTGDAEWQNSILQAGIDSGRIAHNTPLDKSICAVGAGKASPYQQIGICYNPSTQSNPNATAGINEIIYPSGNPNTNPINGFFFEGRNPTAYGTYGNRAYSRYMNLRNTAPAQYEFLPSGVYNVGNDKQNGNFSLSPFTSYNTRSILLAIEVKVADNAILPDEPTGPPSATWRSLETWKNSYSDRVITGARVRGLVFSTYNSSTHIMHYSNTQGTSTNYRHPVGWAIADELSFYYGVGNHSMYSYALMNGTGFAGEITFFEQRTGLYRMKSAGFNDVQDDYVGFMGMAQYIAYAVSTKTAVWYQIEYSDDIYDDLMRAAATFGCPFTPKAMSGSMPPALDFHEDFTDQDLCLPIINNAGIADGDYTRGLDNASNPFINLTDVREKNYNPFWFDIYAGSKRVRKIYLGAHPIKTAYIGNTKL